MGREYLFIQSPLCAMFVPIPSLPWSLVKFKTLVPAGDQLLFMCLFFTLLSSLSSQDQSSLRKGTPSS